MKSTNQNQEYAKFVTIKYLTPILTLIELKTNSFLKWGFIENSKNTRILLGNCISKFPDKSWNFLENLRISKINFGFFKKIFEYFIEISRIIKKILFFYFGNSKIFQKIPRIIRKFRNVIAKQNSDIFRNLIKPHFKKEFAFINTIAIKQGSWLWLHIRWIIQRCKDRGKTEKKTWWIF